MRSDSLRTTSSSMTVSSSMHGRLCTKLAAVITAESGLRSSCASPLSRLSRSVRRRRPARAGAGYSRHA